MKYLGMIMIILVSSYLGLMMTRYKKSQIVYIENVIYMSNRIKMLLSSTMPTTESIMLELSKDDRLSDFKIERGEYIVNNNDYHKIKSLIDSIGLYDVQTQLLMLSEFIDYFNKLFSDYNDDYLKSYKIYIFGGISIGIIISILLI